MRSRIVSCAHTGPVTTWSWWCQQWPVKPTACLINVARGGLIDEEAMYEALLHNKIGGAGLDAFAQEPVDPTRPVYALPNVCVTPHTAGSTDGTSRKRAAFAAETLKRFADGDPLAALVE